MAAEAILASGVTEILKRLVAVVVKEIGLPTREKEELEKLQSTLNMILAVMTDAERKQWNDASVKLWMKELKDVAYKADDILDEFSYYKILRPHNKVRDFFSFSLGHKIKNINEEFNVISSRRDKLGLVNSIGSSSDTTISDFHQRPETYSHVDASKIFGRQKDKLEIINMLRMFEDEAVSVIPIVGRGGLGKTTLAQLVYKDVSKNFDVGKTNLAQLVYKDVSKKFDVGKTTLAQLVYKDVSNFDVKMWVCVGQTFNVKRILVNITESITKGKCEDISNFYGVVNRLQEHLRGKKFLLVLDDVWNLDKKEWDKLKKPLTVGAVGSKIIITTRSQTVASTVIGVGNKSFSAYQLQPLEDSDCWSIFTQRAFGASGGAAKTSSLDKIGKELLTRCDGLPLAVNFLGSLLRNKEEKEWLVIKDSETWDTHVLRDGKTNYRILPVVKLSYDHLPSHLKQCFSYCSIFPKNSEIKRETLIQLWIAEGFLSQSDATKEMSLKEIGSMYFKYLLNNSFFQDVHGYGETLTFKIHDLVLDLARSVSGIKECLIMAEISDHNMKYISQTRRLRLVNLDEQILADALDKLDYGKNLRSLFVNEQISRSINIRSVIDNNHLLRVLDLSGTNLEALPPSIGDLIHLRYLDLSNTNITMLPESFSNLYNLQTLKLIATKIPRVPKGMENLSNLKHFKFTLRMLELPREGVYTEL